MFGRCLQDAERAQRAKRTERSGSLPRFEIPGEFPFCKYCFCFLVLAWTFLALFYLSSLYALPVHARKGLCWGWFCEPRRAQDASKTRQDAPRRAQDAPRRAETPPRLAQDTINFALNFERLFSQKNNENE